MSAATEPAEKDRTVAETPGVFISRQPVLDARRRVTGYRIAYASGRGDDAGDDVAGDGSATRLFGDIITVVGLQELVGTSLAHVPVTRRLLQTLGIPPVRPDQVVLRVAYSIAADPEMRRLLEALADRGYALSLYDLPGTAFDEDLLRLFGIVEVDPAAADDIQTAIAVGKVLGARATPLAVGLRTDEQFERAKVFGFELFAGSFFSRPRTTAVRHVPVGSLSMLASVARMQGDGATIEQLERVIDRDLGLSVKLLLYINSAHFMMRSKITSIRQAVMMLGARGVARWAMMVALTGGTAAPLELSIMALSRARMCELLAAGRADVAADEMFTIGLLSMADALLDTPLDRVLEELPLTDEVAVALLEQTGPAGEILEAVTSYEVGSFSSSSVRAHGDSVAHAYLEALRWARDTAQGLG
jgi:EAL and modified HD-GYP domain-containing signal transduction protein